MGPCREGRMGLLHAAEPHHSHKRFLQENQKDRRGPEASTNGETETDHRAAGPVPGFLVTRGTDMVNNMTTLFIYHVGQRWWRYGVLDTGSLWTSVAGVIFLGDNFVLRIQTLKNVHIVLGPIKLF